MTEDPGRAEQLRRGIPEVAGKVAEVIVDNPGQVALITAGSIVLCRAVLNVVRPRTPVEGLAVMIVLQLGLPKLAQVAVERGWLQLRVRDADGRLVPLIPGKVVPDDPVQAPG